MANIKLAVLVLLIINSVGSSDPPPPAALYQGYDSINGYGLSTAMEGDIATNGGTILVQGSLCLDTQSLYQALGVGASVSVGFDLFTGGAMTDFVNALQLTTYSLTVVVRSYHSLGTDTMTDSRLKDGIQTPTNDDQLSTFVLDYGDSFISSLTTGSEYYAVYAFNAESESDQQTVIAQLNAIGIGSVFTVDASLQSSLDSVVSSTTVSWVFEQSESGVSYQVLPDRNNFINYSLNFPNIVPDAPVILSYESTGYEHVAGIDYFQPVVNNRNYFVGNGGLATAMAQLTDLLNDINAMKSTYDFYNVQDPTLAANQQQVQSDVGSIQSQVVEYGNDPLTNFTRPPLPSLSLNPPQLNYQVGYSPAWGGSGGTAYSFEPNVPNYLRQQTYISAIGTSTGEHGSIFDETETVHELIVTYQPKGASSYVESHGKQDNSPVVFALEPSQRVLQFYGRFGDVVDQLNMVFNDGLIINAGGNGGSPYNWTMPADAMLLGFCGRSGDELDQYQAYYVTLYPTTW